MEFKVTVRDFDASKDLPKLTTEELSPYQFRCNKCGAVHNMSPWSIAQQTMKVKMVFTCECGNRINL